LLACLYQYIISVTQFYSWRRNSSRIVDLTVLDRFGYQDADKMQRKITRSFFC
jgi:hypothetical protein